MEPLAWPSARNFGALGDGLADDAPALQRALEACGGRLYFGPAGIYKIGKNAARARRHFPLGGRARHRESRGTARLPAGANTSSPTPAMRTFASKAASGTATTPATRAAICSIRGHHGHVAELPRRKGAHAAQHDPARPGMLLHPPVRSARFSRGRYPLRLAAPAPQPGWRASGRLLRKGVIRRLRGAHGSPQRRFCGLQRGRLLHPATNFDIIPGPIRDILVDGLQADACHTFVRLLSVDAEISNIVVRNVRGGFEACAVNMDAARYCRTPIVPPEDPRFAQGVGQVRDVRIENMQVHPVGNLQNPALCLETDVDGFEMRHFQVTGERSPICACVTQAATPSRFQGLQCPTSVFTAGCQLTDGVCTSRPWPNSRWKRAASSACALNGPKAQGGVDKIHAALSNGGLRKNFFIPP